jgi:hypothetical protein
MNTWTNPLESEIKQYKIIAMIFAKHPKLLEFFFDKKEPKLNWPPDEMLDQASVFSSGEYVLIKVALDIWSGSGDALLWEILDTLDNDNFTKVIKGLIFFRSQNN